LRKRELALRYRTRLAIATAIFLIAGGAGVLRFSTRTDQNITTRPAAELCSQPKTAPSLRGLADILLSNAAVFANLVLGGALIWIRSLTQLLGVGFDAGTLVYVTLRVTRSPLFTVAAFVPHGIAEIAAFLGAAATGIRVGCVTLNALRRLDIEWKTETGSLGHELRVPAALLVAAALIEEFVTTRVMDYVSCT